MSSSTPTTAGNMGKTHLLAYVTHPESITAIRNHTQRASLSDVHTETGTAAEATSYLKTHASPHILIVDVPSAEAAPALLDALADAVHPDTRVIVTGSIDTLSFYNWLIGLGIHDYLLSPFTEAQLAASLNKLKQPEAAAQKSDSKTTPRHIIAVIGARGGVGTTTIATTIAAIASRELQQPTALIDLDLHFGTTALSLDLEAGRGMRDAFEKPERVDTLFLERLMLRPFSPLAILANEESLAETIHYAPDSAERVLSTLRETYAVIVADIPRHLDAPARHTLASADTIIIVAEPTIASLRDALRLKDYCSDTLKRKSLHILINREGLSAKQEIPKAEFTKHLGSEPAARLPFIADIMAITAQGQLLLDEPKAAAVASTLRKLTRTWLGHDASSTPAAKGIASLFKGKK